MILEALSKQTRMRRGSSWKWNTEFSNGRWRFYFDIGMRGDDFMGHRFALYVSISKPYSEDLPPVYDIAWAYWTLACGVRPWEQTHNWSYQRFSSWMQFWKKAKKVPRQWRYR